MTWPDQESHARCGRVSLEPDGVVMAGNWGRRACGVGAAVITAAFWPAGALAALDSAPTFSTDARTVRVPVSVVDKGGRPVLDLRSEDFRLSEDNRPQKVTLFSSERRPLRIALALDISRSMENKIRQVQEALRHFIDILEPADEILVITFNDEVEVVQDFTSDRQRLGEVLSKLEPEGGTALYDAADEAIQQVAAAPAESKAVVLVTDGIDSVSSISLKDLRELARRTEVPVFSIGLDFANLRREIFDREPVGGWSGGRRGWPGGGRRGGWPGGGGWGGWPGGGYGERRPAGFDAGPLTDLADETGARAEIVKGGASDRDGTPGSERLKSAVESIAAILRHRYLLGYEPPASPHGWRTIRVGVVRPDTTAHARKSYYAGD